MARSGGRRCGCGGASRPWGTTALCLGAGAWEGLRPPCPAALPAPPVGAGCLLPALSLLSRFLSACALWSVMLASNPALSHWRWPCPCCGLPSRRVTGRWGSPGAAPVSGRSLRLRRAGAGPGAQRRSPGVSAEGTMSLDSLLTECSRAVWLIFLKLFAIQLI